MTVAKAMKSPGQKPKTPKKETQSPGNIKSPKIKGPATPNPKANFSKQKTPLKGQGTGTPKPKTPNVGAAKPKTPNAGTPKPKTPNVGTPKPKTPIVGATPKQAKLNVTGTPKLKTPNAKGTPKPKTPNANGTPALKTPNKQGSPKSMVSTGGPTPNSKTPKSGKKGGQKTPKGKGPVAPVPNSASKVFTPKPKNPKAAQSPVKKEINTAPVVHRKRSASAAGLDKPSDAQIVFKSVRIYNLPPQIEEEPLLKQITELLEPRGEIHKIRLLSGKQKQNRHIQVEFTKAEDARAAKKLNGHLVGGRHLTIVHHDDRDLPADNRVVLSNVPTDLEDEDVWSLFGSCGKILCIHMNRDWRTKKVQRCFVTFETKKGSDLAASSQKTCRRREIIVKKAGKDGKMFPVESSVFISNLSTDTSEKDINDFVSKSGPVSGIVVIEAKKRYAMVHMTNESDVDKVLKLNGQEFNGKQIEVERHRKSQHYVKKLKQGNSQSTKTTQEVPAKKLKQNNGAAKVKEEPDDDEEDVSEEGESGDDLSDAEDEDLLAAFSGKLQKLKSAALKAEEDEDDDEEDDDEEDDDEEDDDEEDDDEDMDDEEDDDEDDEDGEDDDDEDGDDDDDE